MFKRKNKNNNFQDSDADGLSDDLEKKLGTDPFKADSDNDGVNDYEEINIYQTDPLNPDTDHDGIKDGDEIKRGDNPKGPGLLKDLFIPSASNNYQPKALHPYRLLFYALSSILFKVILIGAVIVLPIEAWLTPDILTEQSKKIISLTNTIRKNLRLTALTESSLLNRAAYEKAEDMLLYQYFAHTGPNKKTLADWLEKVQYNYAVAGENLAMGFSSPEEVVNGWSRSQTHYRNMIDPDFSEIGVGMTSGLYENIDTTLVAQYFASPFRSRAPRSAGSEQEAIAKPVEAKNPLNQEINQPAVAADKAQLLGEKVQENQTAKPSQSIAGAEIKPLEIDLANSQLFIDQPQGQNQYIIRAEVSLRGEASRAWITFNSHIIDLQKNSATGRWTGQTIVFKDSREQIFNPVILPVVTAEDKSGNRITADLAWDNVKPSNTTVLEQYLFVRKHQSPYLSPLFNITSVFYKIILVIASIALALNILIEIKRQYPHIILSTLVLICLLIALIII
ncbi:MAG: CAP domain-containing protein [Patescibacteria group bacterium]|nr:CAP domain-containing protein [Patescibacteria group bacterium]